MKHEVSSSGYTSIKAAFLALLTASSLSIGWAAPATPPKPAAASVPVVSTVGAPVKRDPLTFEDLIGREWTNEAVRVPLTDEMAKQVKAGRAILGPDGQSVPYQSVSGANAIELMVNVPQWQKSIYKFGEGAPSSKTDLKVEETDTSIRLTNSRIGLSLRKKLDAGQGPVENIQLASGKWVGDSRLDTKLAPSAYSAKVLTRGPVFCEVQCNADFGNGSTWQLTFRLNANEPVIEVDENFSLGDAYTTFSLSLSDNFKPTKLFYRNGLGESANKTSEIKPGVAFVLEPWERWWNRPEEGPAISMYSDDSPDMLSVGAGFAGQWVDPKIAAEKRIAPWVNGIQDDKGLHLDFVLKNGRRNWMIMTPDKDESLKVLNDPNLTYTPPLPHQYVIKHGQFPLNIVKDYILDWDGSKEKFPHLLVTSADVDKMRAANKDTKIEERELSSVINTWPLGQWTMERPLSLFFATGNEQIGKYLSEGANRNMREAVDTFLLQPYVPYGSAPHHQQTLGSAPLVVDGIAGTTFVTPEQRRRLMAQIAFCCYAMNRPDYWSEERGYAANPNMTTSVYGYEVAMGSSISTHPMAKEWVSNALKGLYDQLVGWSDSNGGWLEAPHYAMVSYDAILGSAYMAHNAGLNDMVYDPQIKKVINWFSKMSTPPDPRFGGYRHLPPIGNTYISEPTGEFGIVARIFKDKDPQFASEMQWMYRQHHSWPYPGIGGGYPTMTGYRKLLEDDSIPEKAPKWTSEMFPKTGVILRNGFPTDRETHLHLLAGGFGGWRSHWDDDSGSFTLWGKGRIIADDFGYYGAAPSEDHNMIDGPPIRKTPDNIFDVSSFVPEKYVDYVTGERSAWQRQIAFIKNDDPLQANYYVVCDTTKIPEAGIWRLWTTSNSVTPNGNTATIDGKDDVDTDMYFATEANLDMKTEVKKRTSGSGNRPDGSQGATETTQNGLIFNFPGNTALTYVIYPRLKTEQQPVFTTLADGKGVRVQSAAGTDYVFLSSSEFTFEEGTISFKGKAGSVRFKGKQLILTLSEGGSIAARGQSLVSEKPIQKVITLK